MFLLIIAYNVLRIRPVLSFCSMCTPATNRPVTKYHFQLKPQKYMFLSSQNVATNIVVYRIKYPRATMDLIYAMKLTLLGLFYVQYFVRFCNVM
jgi:hypothetical protein